MIEAALVAYLQADANITAVVGSRIYPLELPQNATLPALTYENTARSHVRSLTGASGLADADLDINCWAATYADAKTAAEAVRNTLDGFRGTMTDGNNSYNVNEIALTNESDSIEPSPGLEQARLYTVNLSLTVWFNEPKPTLT